MLDCLTRVVSLRESLRKKLVRFNLLFPVTRLLAELEERLAVLHCPVKLTLCLIDHTDLLVALSFNVPVLGPLSDTEALFEELERHIELVQLEILNGNQLVHSHQVF